MSLKPGFEIMGNPSNLFTDFDNATQLSRLSSLVGEIGRRYVDRFGLDYVKLWNFETWNEPDHKRTWDFPLNRTMTVSAYLNYFDAV